MLCLQNICYNQPDEEEDSDTAPPTDGDETESEADGDTDAGESDNPFAALPACKFSEENFPCRYDLPFVMDEATGEFRIGQTKTYGISGLAASGDYVVYKPWRDEASLYDCLATIHLPSHKSAIIASSGRGGYWPSIFQGKILWARMDDEWIDTIVLSTLPDLQEEIISSHPSFKLYPFISSTGYFWNDGRDYPTGSHKTQIYTRLPDGSEVRVDPSADYGAGGGDAHGDWLVYSASPSNVYVRNLRTSEERLIGDRVRGKVLIWGSHVAWSDRSLGSDIYTECGYSVRQYNIESGGDATYVKSSSGLNDYFPTDLWEDWLVYTSYDEGGSSDEATPQCWNVEAKGDVFLHYLPTGEEWNITNRPGHQDQGVMSGRWILWQDGREEPGTQKYEDLYGLDLCRHPELKQRLAACEETAR